MCHSEVLSWSLPRRLLDYYINAGYKGIVIEGTGLTTWPPSPWIDSIRKATEKDIPVIITSQCLRGRICDRVYDTGRYMLEAGALEGGDMLPEVAMVKLMWVLANASRGGGKNAMEAPLAGEISASTPITT